MPHKRNPIAAEQLVGIARVLRSYVGPTLEDVAVWNERDITHSSVERVIVPDALTLAHYILVASRRLVESLQVDERHIAFNLRQTLEGMASSAVLHHMIASGSSRDVAYRLVQEAAHDQVTSGLTFRAAVAAKAGEAAAAVVDAFVSDPPLTGARLTVQTFLDQVPGT
jgi:adenylosuccinate lyase